MAGMNEAYDLEMFQKREPHLVALQNNKKAVKDSKKRTRRHARLNVVVYLLACVIVMAMVGYFITGNVRLTEMNKEINDCQTELNVLQSERVRLEAELAGKNSAEQLHAYAQEHGMITIDSNQTYYIAVQDEDAVTVPAKAGSWLSRLWDKLWNLSR